MGIAGTDHGTHDTIVQMRTCQTRRRMQHDYLHRQDGDPTAQHSVCSL